MFGILCCCGSVTFAEETDRKLDKNQPIEITAQHLEVLERQRQSIFTGDVVAIQGDMTLSADRLVISLQESQDQIDRLDAIGGVRVVQLDRVDIADKAFLRQA